MAWTPSMLHGMLVFPQDLAPPWGAVVSWSSLPPTFCFCWLLLSIWHLLPFCLCSNLYLDWELRSTPYSVHPTVGVIESLKCQGKSLELDPESSGGHLPINVFSQQVLLRTYYVPITRDKMVSPEHTGAWSCLQNEREIWSNVHK